MSPHEIKTGDRLFVTLCGKRIAVEVLGSVDSTPFWRGRELKTGVLRTFSADNASPLTKPLVKLEGIKAGKHLLNRAAKALDEASLPGGDVLRNASADSIGAAISIAREYVDVEGEISGNAVNAQQSANGGVSDEAWKAGIDS